MTIAVTEKVRVVVVAADEFGSGPPATAVNTTNFKNDFIESFASRGKEGHLNISIGGHEDSINVLCGMHTAWGGSGLIFVSHTQRSMLVALRRVRSTVVVHGDVSTSVRGQTGREGAWIGQATSIGL